MNKVFLFALLALVAACAAAPQGFSPVEATPGHSVKQIDAMPIGDLTAHEQTKRAILYRAPVQYRTLSGIEYPGYEYNPAYYHSAYSYPTYGRYFI